VVGIGDHDGGWRAAHHYVRNRFIILHSFS
jgi:hypothetical protein